MRIEYNKLLQNFTTIKIGGLGDVFIEVEAEEELSQILYSSYRRGINWKVLGGGSKVLIPDDGIRGIILRLKGKLLNYIKVEGNKVTVAGGKPLKKLLFETIKNNVVGLEFLLGIPGTVGGAIKTNAGFDNYSFGDYVKKIKLVDKKGDIFWLDKKDLDFKYRYSNLAENCIVIEVELELKNKSEKDTFSKLREIKDKRLQTQPQLKDYPNCGCIFKNPKEKPAGWLLEKAGCKSMSRGSAAFSQIHANFIINYGGATFEDVLYLINFAKERVWKEFSILLEEEVKIFKN